MSSFYLILIISQKYSFVKYLFAILKLTDKSKHAILDKANISTTKKAKDMFSAAQLLNIKLVVGSQSSHKLRAVREALAYLSGSVSPKVRGIKASSGVNAQPEGFEEILGGALTRAYFVKNTIPSAFALGIENGLLGARGIFLDFAVIVLLTPDGRQIITTSTGIEFPPEYVRIARKIGFETTTVGSVIEEELGSAKGDPHSGVTKGALSREDTLTDGLIRAFQQLVR